MRVDDRRHRVGGVVETVDELKAQGHEQRHPKQDVRKPGKRPASGIADIAY